MSLVTIKSGRIQLYSQVIASDCERVTASAVLPENMQSDWEGATINLIDWRIADDRKSVKLEYQSGNSVTAPIMDCTLALQVEHSPLPRPGRSKNWVWRTWSACWVNNKTGERVSVY